MIVLKNLIDSNVLLHLSKPIIVSKGGKYIDPDHTVHCINMSENHCFVR